MIAKPNGRPRVGQPISITVTDEQRAWIDARIPPGGTRTQVVRALVQGAIALAVLEEQKQRVCAQCGLAHRP